MGGIRGEGGEGGREEREGGRDKRGGRRERGKEKEEGDREGNRKGRRESGCITLGMVRLKGSVYVTGCGISIQHPHVMGSINMKLTGN